MPHGDATVNPRGTTTGVASPPGLRSNPTKPSTPREEPHLNRHHPLLLRNALVNARKDFGLIMYYVIKCAMHYHHYTLARQMVTKSSVVNTF